MNIVALDLSKHSAGVAIGDASGAPRTLRVQFTQPEMGAAWAAYAKWLRDLLVIEKPGLVAVEAALMLVDRTSSADTTRLLLGFAAHTASVCAMRGVRHVEVAAMTWRKAFLGHGRPVDPKQAAMLMCDRLGWPHGGVHDRAEAAGILAWAHLYHGDQRGMQRLLSASSVRAMGGGA